MRNITSHQVVGSENVNLLNMELQIQVLDEPGPGGANHHYYLTSYGTDEGFPGSCTIQFQKGPIKEVGLTGVSNEALLAVVIDRLQGFQRGEYPCRENALALTKLEEALHWLKHRTLERMSRGVEGTSQK